MTTQVISTTIDYVKTSSYLGKWFIATLAEIRPEKALTKGFFMYVGPLYEVLHNKVKGFSGVKDVLLPGDVMNLLKGAAVKLQVNVFEEGEEMDEDGEKIADDTTYVVNILAIKLAEQGQKKIQEADFLKSLKAFGFKELLLKKLEEKAASLGGSLDEDGDVPVDEAASDAGDTDDAPAATDDIPAYMRKDVKRSSLSDDDKTARTAYLKAGNKLV